MQAFLFARTGNSNEHRTSTSAFSGLSNINVKGQFDTTTEIVGAVLLFLPYLTILIPYLRAFIGDSLRSFYFHETPRTTWNRAVDPHPPRKVGGYLLSMIILCTPCVLILVKNHGKHGFWFDFIQLFVYLSIPIFLSILRPLTHVPLDTYDFCIILFILVPMEIAKYSSDFLPDKQFSIYEKAPSVSMLNVSTFNMGILVFYVLRPLKDIGLGFDHRHLYKFGWMILRFLFTCIVFSVVAIPVGYAFGFIHKPHAINAVWKDGIAKFAIMYFLISLPLEFLFRGVIQNIIHSRFESQNEADIYRTSCSSFDDVPIDLEDPMNPSINDKTADVPFLKEVEFDSLDGSDVAASALSEAAQNRKYSNQFQMLQRQIIARTHTPPLRNGCAMGIIYWLNLRNGIRDWISLLLSSILFAAILTDWSGNDSIDLLGSFVLICWLGLCCGWLWRHSNSCFVSAILQCIVIFIGKYVVSNNGKLCDGAC